jgi:hypothetical protein
VVLQGSLDGVQWVTLATSTNPAINATYVSVAGVAMRYVRAFTSAALTGGTVSATVASSG